ncbi:transcription initiation factor TFIID subunit 9-like [Triticum dicoccoides]|uniref:transcription initiation factor TFIID subunit 9-like n=1 Tax=Triticum dicoccoides TaxID=85692 RepID=UPI0018903D79|nr:transcription initiation factor TFIID subunit 9-like [Triticum dicoccoides]
MDGGGGGGRPALQPAAAGGGASGPDEPRDARVVRELLRSMGLGEGEYEPRVVHQFLDLAYRYAGDVLGDAQVYADHAGKPQLDADDVRLAIQAKVNFSFSQPPPREVLLELARSRNKIPLPKSIAPPGSIPLPPEQDTLLSQNYQLLPALKLPAQTEEAEDEEEGANADAANANPNSSQDQRGNEQQQQPQSQSQGQRVSFQLNAVAAAAAKRPRMTIDQLNMG